MTEKTVINIGEVPLVDRGNGKQFAVKWGRVGPLIGLNSLGCAVHVVPPGKKAFPFHRHHVQDELFFVVSGEGKYRFGETTVPVRSGDIVAAPAGTQAHQLINTGADLPAVLLRQSRLPIPRRTKAAESGEAFPLPQLVAIDDGARNARHIVEDAALDKRVYSRSGWPPILPLNGPSKGNCCLLRARDERENGLNSTVALHE